MAPRPDRPTLFETLGCRLNAYETEAMRELAAAAGLDDAAVVNSCAVTAEAVRQTRQTVRRLKRERPDRPVIVTGCAAQTEPETFAAMAEVDLVLGNLEKMRPETWSALARSVDREAGTGAAKPFAALLEASEKILVNDILSATETSGHLIDGFGSRARAHVQVQNGCDHRCTFCIIPYGRGNARSVPAGVVVEQIKRLVGRGYNEVVLTGVDLTSWGGDLPGRPPLGDLVQRILRLVPDLPRLRLSSIDSIEADPALVEAIAGDPRLMPHLHLSLQAGDNLILKRMKRRHLREDSVRFCAEMRAARPEIVFGADLIVGFPTETEAQFDNTIALVEECGLTYLHVFPFSPRDGTPAARMPQTAKSAIRDRAARLRAVGAARRARYLTDQVGATHRALMEQPTVGRTETFAEIAVATPRPVGSVVPLRVAGVEADRRLIAA